MYRLVKALYGLRQAPRAWNAKLDKCLKELGFEKCQHDHAVYTKCRNGSVLIVGVYVDDLLVSYGTKLVFDKDEGGQKVDATEYRSLVGSLRYLTHTRPNITYAVGVVSRFMEAPTVKHHQAMKHIVRYVKGTVNHGLVYARSEDKKSIVGYTDSDLAGDVVDQRSTGGMCFYLNGSLISWASQKYGVIALSSCEVEYMAATTVACQSIWIQGLLREISGHKIGVVMLHV
ncbi:secreted RxLR effector protein 161-like [Apium graveolens]|uniref:secreted RxLR effector protein 161-like n=1 Tax=Apium graveolens TaxID=4045 RepID=UPI003D7B59A2